MATSLATKSIGSPDNAFAWYLQSGGISLATGFPVALGDGTETKLWIDADGIGFTNSGGFRSSFRCDTTAHQTITFHPTAGTGKVYPDLVAVLAADTSNSTVTPATVGSFSVTLAASSVYEFEAVLVFTSAATTTGPRFTLNGPSAQTDFIAAEVTLPQATGASITAWGAATNTTSWPTTGAHIARIRGVVKTTASTPATAVTLDIFSEVGASAITLKAGSSMRFRKIN